MPCLFNIELLFNVVIAHAKKYILEVWKKEGCLAGSGIIPATVVRQDEDTKRNKELKWLFHLQFSSLTI